MTSATVRSAVAAVSVVAASACTPARLLDRLSVSHDVERCSAAQLRITLGPWGGALGTGIAFVQVVNRSPTECEVRGYPQMQMLNRRYRQMAGEVAHGAADAWPDLGPRRIALPPGGAASAAVAWGDNGITLPDGEQESCRPVHALLVAFRGTESTVVIPGKGRRYGPYTIHVCDGTMSVTALEPGRAPTTKR